MNQDEISYQEEVQLLGYGESDSYGPWIKLRLMDEESLSAFRGQEKGMKTGKRYACVLVEIGDDEKPVKQPKKRSLSQEAAMMVAHPNFYRYALHLRDQLGVKEDREFNQRLQFIDPGKGKEYENPFSDCMLKFKLGIKSKRELDTADYGLIQYYKFLVKDYGEFCKRNRL